MADGTFKLATELLVGDIIKTIDIPNPFDVEKADDLANYKISLTELETGTTYSTNAIIDLKEINLYTHTIKLTFTDNTEWFDNENAHYLSLRNNEVRFLALSLMVSSEYNVTIGDTILLLDVSNPDIPIFVPKEIANIEQNQQFFGGYEITVERDHLFLTKSDSNSPTSYVSIEHNPPLCFANDGNVCTQGNCVGKTNFCVVSVATRTPCMGGGSCVCSSTCSAGAKI